MKRLEQILCISCKSKQRRQVNKTIRLQQNTHKQREKEKKTHLHTIINVKRAMQSMRIPKELREKNQQ